MTNIETLTKLEVKHWIILSKLKGEMTKLNLNYFKDITYIMLNISKSQNVKDLHVLSMSS